MKIYRPCRFYLLMHFVGNCDSYSSRRFSIVAPHISMQPEKMRQILSFEEKSSEWEMSVIKKCPTNVQRDKKEISMKLQVVKSCTISYELVLFFFGFSSSRLHGCELYFGLTCGFGWEEKKRERRRLISRVKRERRMREMHARNAKK